MPQSQLCRIQHGFHEIDAPFQSTIKVDKGGPLDRRIVDILFVAAVVVLSYIASVHLVTDRVVEKLQASHLAERADRTPVLGGPVQLRPIVSQRTHGKPVIYKAKPVVKHKIADRKPSSLKKKKKHNKHK